MNSGVIEASFYSEELFLRKDCFTGSDSLTIRLFPAGDLGIYD